MLVVLKKSRKLLDIASEIINIIKFVLIQQKNFLIQWRERKFYDMCYPIHIRIKDPKDWFDPSKMWKSSFYSFFAHEFHIWIYKKLKYLMKLSEKKLEWTSEVKWNGKFFLNAFYSWFLNKEIFWFEKVNVCFNNHPKMDF